MNYTIACEILGVSENDTLKDITKKYRKLARKYHPDINKDKDATEKTQQINDAYDYIKKISIQKIIQLNYHMKNLYQYVKKILKLYFI
jgi:DnaJ-class molecular chaperone